MASEAISSVKQGRLQRGMTLWDLAEKCTKEGAPVRHSTLSRIERGIQMPRPKLRLVLARILELDVNDFERQVTGPASAA
jgi:transcriptional regulator with XRE-family HTH domain